MTRKLKSFVWVAFVFVVVFIAIFAIFQHLGTPKCSLSLCDCKCYFEGITPEEYEGKVCDKNCTEKNITGCAYVKEIGDCLTTPLTCEKLCQTKSHVLCIGHWVFSETYPDCDCQYICTGVCQTDSDCPQPRCPDMHAVCEDEICKIRSDEGKLTRCVS